MTPDLEKYRHVHFVGIGGIGMSALARMLASHGHEVSGSDRAAGEQTGALQAMGLPVSIGHRAENAAGADLIVVTSAAASDNPEILWAQEHNVPILKRSELLGAIMNPKRGIAVAGTHGKTTTSALIAHLLTEGGLNPTVLIGGISGNLGSNARVGGDIVVAEADEYDASFLQLRPSVGVILNAEAEHLDFYGTEAAVHQAFEDFARRVRDVLVVCADDPGAMRAAKAADARVVTYGLEAGNWRAEDIVERGGSLHFTVRHGGEGMAVRTDLSGVHNVRNVLAGVAVARVLGVSSERIVQAIAGFRGVARRTQVIGEARGVLVIDDYAHHPSEIKTVLHAVRARHERPIRVLFQPHTYSRTRNHLREFAESFGDAEAVYVLDIYAAREAETLGMSGQVLVAATREHHPSVRYAGSPERALEQVVADTSPGDVVITMGAGDVNELAPRILQRVNEP